MAKLQIPAEEIPKPQKTFLVTRYFKEVWEITATERNEASRGIEQGKESIQHSLEFTHETVVHKNQTT